MSRTNDNLGVQVKDLLAGFNDPTAFPKGMRSIVVGTESYTLPQLAKALKGHDDLWRTPDDLSAAFHAAVQARESRAPAVREFATDVRHAIVAALGSRNPDLLKFGIEPKRDKRKLTSEERAHAAALARATRKERHTMGRRQKETVTGSLESAPTPNGVQPTPNAAPLPADKKPAA